jgi:hypothetical protein
VSNAATTLISTNTVQAQASSHGDAPRIMEVPAGSVLEYLDRRHEQGFEGRPYWEFVAHLRGRRVFCTSFARPI